MLTGLDLYDGQPRFDTVIGKFDSLPNRNFDKTRPSFFRQGLAWVSGMCYDDYSCTINEGSNYESVYVIAHEMGHKLAFGRLLLSSNIS